MSNTNLVDLVQNLIAVHKPGTDLERTLRIACPWLHALSAQDRLRCVTEISAAAHNAPALRAELMAWEACARAIQRGSLSGVTAWIIAHEK